MRFHAYPNRQGSVVVSHDIYDEQNGTLGRLVAKPNSIGDAESIDLATEIAYAHLGRAPSDAVYIADDNDIIRKVVFNDAYHKERENSERWVCMSIALLVLCFTTFIGTIVTELGLGGLLLFSGIAILYVFVVRTRIQNEVEGAVVCFIILVLIFFLLPAVRVARDRSTNAGPGRTIRCTGAAKSHFLLVENLSSPPRDR